MSVVVCDARSQCCWCKKPHDDGTCCAHRVTVDAPAEMKPKDVRSHRRGANAIGALLLPWHEHLPPASRWRYRGTGDVYLVEAVSHAAGDLRRAGYEVFVTYRSETTPLAVFTKTVAEFTKDFERCIRHD